MKCPDGIAEILIEILKHALLRIRNAGWRGDGERCAIEADHVHNLPSLLIGYSDDLLKYYWEVEMPAFIAEAGERFEPFRFELLWRRLEPFVQDTRRS